MTQLATELLKLSPEAIKDWLQTFDAVLTDCDGVIWNYDEIIENANLVINKFKDNGKKVFFATNNSTKTREEFANKARNLKFNISKEDILSTAYIAAKHLSNIQFKRKVYVLGSPAIGKELDTVGIEHIGIGPDILSSNYAEFATSFHKTQDPDIGAVLVGFDEHFSFPKMTKAATYLDNPDCLFIATNTDERLPLPNAVIPGCGSMVRSIETISERQALIMGKPNPNFCKDLIAEHKLNPKRILMIGDRCNTDILLGTNCGFQTLLVGTGIHSLKDVDLWKSNDSDEDKKLIPDYYLPKLGDLLPFM